MGTKNNPGAFDCYAKAGPDEPIFTLRAKDPLAPDMVHLWRALRVGDIYEAIQIFAELSKIVTMDGIESDKMAEATNCAQAMSEWRQENVED